MSDFLKYSWNCLILTYFALLHFRPEYDFTSQYIVKVDDFFLHYLQRVRLFTYRLCQILVKDRNDFKQSIVHEGIHGIEIQFSSLSLSGKNPLKVNLEMLCGLYQCYNQCLSALLFGEIPHSLKLKEHRHGVQVVCFNIDMC